MLLIKTIFVGGTLAHPNLSFPVYRCSQWREYFRISPQQRARLDIGREEKRVKIGKRSLHD